MQATAFSYPVFGPEIRCPHCNQTIAALTLTDSYLCPRHGAFEADPETKELVHLQSGRKWRLWEEKWYRQHTHADGIRFEIHEALDGLHAQGMRATAVEIAARYRPLLQTYLEHTSTRRPHKPGQWRLYGLPATFSDEPTPDDSRWAVVNFDLTAEKGPPLRYPYFRLFE
ncbi:MAG: TIGR02652 family protein [Cyanobacteria bacterium J06648_11]